MLKTYYNSGEFVCINLLLIKNAIILSLIPIFSLLFIPILTLSICNKLFTQLYI